MGSDGVVEKIITTRGMEDKKGCGEWFGRSRVGLEWVVRISVWSRAGG